MDIYAYISNDGEYYCEEHALIPVFNGDKEHLERVKEGTATDIDIIHEDTFQFEAYAGEIIPLAGIFCTTCGNELYSPYEEE